MQVVKGSVMLNDITILTDFQSDALNEVGNIGMGNAATSLSKLVNKEVMIRIPVIKLTRIEDVPDIVGGAETLVEGILMYLEGDVSGYIMILFPADAAKLICQMLSGNEDCDIVDEMNKSLIQEVGHIIAGTYVTALSDFFNISMGISPPYGTYDMAGAILDYILIEMSREVEHALVFDTEFSIGGTRIEGHFFVLFDTSSLELILNKIDNMVH